MTMRTANSNVVYSTASEGGTIAAPVLISASSSGNAFEVRQLGAGNAFVVEDSANPDATPFVIDTIGRTLIGRSTSVVVGGEVGFEPLQVDYSASISRAQAGSSGPGLTLAKSRGTTISATSSVSNGDTLGTIKFTAADGTSFIEAARIESAVDGTPGTNDMPGRLVFSTTADGASSPTERMRIDNAGLITGTGTSLGAWTAYTPTLGGTGWAIGNGTAEGAYCKIGKVVFFRLKITFGSTSTYGASFPTLTLPEAIKSGTDGFQRVHNVSFIDVSTDSQYVGATRNNSTSTFRLYYIGANGLKTSLSSTAPFTWDASDFIEVHGTYEAA